MENPIDVIVVIITGVVDDSAGQQSIGLVGLSLSMPMVVASISTKRAILVAISLFLVLNLVTIPVLTVQVDTEIPILIDVGTQI